MLLVVVVTAAAIVAMPVQAQAEPETLYERNNGAAGAPGNSSIYVDFWSAQTFSSPVPFTLTRIRMSVARVGAPFGITVSIREAAEPVGPVTDRGDVVASDTIDSDDFSTSPAWMDFPVVPTPLDADTSYAIVVRAVYGTSAWYLNWQYSNAAYARGSAYTSDDGGASWTIDGGNDLLFELWGDGAVVINTAEVYSGYLEDDDMLIVMEYLNVCAPYYPDYSVTQ